MNELKTLKDLLECMCGNPPDVECDIEHIFVTKYNLKQEAIKWIKSLENKEIWSYENTCTCGVGSLGVICWIKTFFGITKEDLK